MSPTIARTGLALLALIALLLVALTGPLPGSAQDPTDDATCTADDADCDAAATGGAGGEAATRADDADDDDEGGGTGRFADVEGDLAHVEGIDFLADTGVTRGCRTGNFCPHEPITRGEFATFAYRLAGEDDDDSAVFATAREIAELRAEYDDLRTEYDQLHQDNLLLVERIEALENAASGR